MLEAQDILTNRHMLQGNYAAAEAEARRQLAVDNLRESAHRQLVEALFHRGHRNEALAQYERCRQLLRTELAVEPALETQALIDAIRTGQLQRKRVEQPTVVELSLTPTVSVNATVPPHNLPQYTTQFVGRTRELAALDEFITAATSRLITIVGVGGMGKTRLGLALAERQWQRTYEEMVRTTSLSKGTFPDGVYFVGLEALSAAPQIVFAIAQALEFPVRGEQDPFQQLLNYLHPKRLLLVLDNFEHLLDGVDFLLKIVNNAPAVQLLVTSRERLSTPEEQIFLLSGLESQTGATVTEAEQFAAGQLFIQAARRSRPDFMLTSRDVPNLVQICHCVAGMPLGLELAAAWMDTLPLAEVATQVQKSFDLLETTLHHIPARQRSIRAVFDASWQRLNATERSVFTQLACFRGGFTREAAQDVISLSEQGIVLLRSLAELVRKALIQFDTRRNRYFIHELLRQYGEEKLSQQPLSEASVRDRHSGFYCIWLAARETDLKGAREQAALAEIETEIGNVRAAWAWATEQRQAAQLVQAGDAFALYAEYTGQYQEAEAAFARAVATLQPHNNETRSAVAFQAVVRLLTWQALFTRRQGRFVQAKALLEQALHLQEDPILADVDTISERALLFWHKAILAFPYGADAAAAKQYYTHALELYRKVEDPWGIANTLEFLGELEGDNGNLLEWQRLEEECLAIRQQIGNLRGIANSLHQVANIKWSGGDWDTAEQMMRQSLTLHQQISDRVGATQRLSLLGNTIVGTGKFAEARALTRQALTQQHELGDPFWLALIYHNASYVELHSGNYLDAATLAYKSLDVQQELDANQFLRLIWFAWTQIAQQKYEVALETVLKVQSSSTTNLSPLVQMLQIQQALVVIYYYQKNIHQSRQYVMNVLNVVISTQYVLDLIFVLSIATLLIAEAGKGLRAMELMGLAKRYPLFSYSQWFKDFLWTALAELTASLLPTEIEAAKIRGQVLDPWVTAKQLLQELLELGWPQPNVG